MAATLGLTIQALLLGIVYAVLSTPAAYTSNTNTLAAIIWPAPAIAVAVLWQAQYRQWGIFLVAVFLAMLVVGNRDGLSLNADTAFALLNVFQVLAYALVGRRFVDARGDIDTISKLARYVLFLPFLCTAAVACMGAWIGVVTKNTSWLEEWRVIMVGNGLAILVLLPALMAWCTTNYKQTQFDAKHVQQCAFIAASLIALLLLAAGVWPAFNAETLRIFLSLVLLWAAVQGGIKAASLGIVVAATLGIGMTFYGYGPYTDPAGLDGVWRLQVDLGGMAVLSFFVAAAIHERLTLSSRLGRAKRFETIGLLTGGIAHDFNNVLGAVGGYAELATEQERAGLPVSNALEQVTAAVARGKQLTDQILLAGHRGARTHEIVDLRDIVCESVATIRPLLAADIELVVRVPLEPVYARAHAGQLMRGLLNLLRNASQVAQKTFELNLTSIGAMPQVPTDVKNFAIAPEAIIGESLDRNCALIDVLDDGEGISAQHIHQLFEPFFSARNQPGRNAQGTGLGLAVVAGVANDHEGGVAVWSGQQSKKLFRLMLPLKSVIGDSRTQGTAPKAGPTDAIGRGEIALIFADSASLREHAENLLAESGFEPAGYDVTAITSSTIRQVLSGAQLLLWMCSGRDDPKTSDAYARLRQLAPSLPLIVCTHAGGQDGIVMRQDVVTIHGKLSHSALAQSAKMILGRSGLSTAVVSNTFP